MSVIYKFQKGLRLFVPFFPTIIYFSPFVYLNVNYLRNRIIGKSLSFWLLFLPVCTHIIANTFELYSCLNPWYSSFAFFRLLSFSCWLHVSYQALLMAFVCSKTLLIDLNLGFVKNTLDVDSFRVLKGYTYVRLTARPFVFLTLRRCRYMEGKLSLSLTQFVTTTPRRISNVCKSGICRLSSCNCVPGPVETSILPSNRDNLLCQKKTASNLRLWEQRSRRMRIFLFLLHDNKWAILVCMPDFLSFFYVAEGNKLTISFKEMYHWNWY